MLGWRSPSPFEDDTVVPGNGELGKDHQRNRGNEIRDTADRSFATSPALLRKT